MEEHDGTNALEDIFTSKWFWYTAAALALGIIILGAVWYAKHPDRSIFEDFARQSDNHAEQNGHVPAPTSVVGPELVEDQEST